MPYAQDKPAGSQPIERSMRAGMAVTTSTLQGPAATIGCVDRHPSIQGNAP
jgi:hypothetical protein